MVSIYIERGCNVPSNQKKMRERHQQPRDNTEEGVTLTLTLTLFLPFI